MTVDMGKNCLWYVIRAWCHGETSYLLDYGQIANEDGIFNFQKLLDVSRQEFQGPEGEIFRVTHGFVDSGWEADEVYKFCRRSGFRPLKGTDSTRQTVPIKLGSTGEGLPLLHVQGDYFKDSIYSKLKQRAGEVGSWNLHQQTCDMYATHLTNESPYDKQMPNNTIRRAWKREGEQGLFDCEVYNMAAARYLDFASHLPPPPPQKVTGPAAEANPEPKPQPRRHTRPDGRSYFDLRG